MEFEKIGQPNQIIFIEGGKDSEPKIRSKRLAEKRLGGKDLKEKVRRKKGEE